MRKLFLIFFIFIISISLFGQDKAVRKKPGDYNFKAPRYIEKTNYFGVTINLGIDNNSDFMSGFGISYKYRYKYIGIGGDLELYAFKGFWKKSDVIDIEIPHNDYYTIQNGNTTGGGINIFLVTGYKRLFINAGGTLTFLTSTTTNVSNVTGLKWKGNSESKSYFGPVVQIQYCFLNKNLFKGYDIGLELKLIRISTEPNNLQVGQEKGKTDTWKSLFNFKFGICL